MRTGWLNYNGKVYYLHSSGAMAEGWTQIDKNWYYFYPGYGYKAVNTTIDTSMSMPMESGKSKKK